MQGNSRATVKSSYTWKMTIKTLHMHDIEQQKKTGTYLLLVVSAVNLSIDRWHHLLAAGLSVRLLAILR